MNPRIWSSLQQRPRRSAPATKRDGSEELMVIAQRNGWTPRSSLTMAEINRMGALEFRYHELFSPNAVAAALKADPKLQTTEQSDKKNGREIRPLTYEEITEKMSSEDAAWHMHHNKQNWESAFAEQERRRASKTHVAKTRVELFWSGHQTDEEAEQSRIAGDTFAKQTPTFARTKENANLMCEFMSNNGLDALRVDSYTKAFRELVEQGRIKPLSYESADQFLSKHEELLPKAVPPLVASKQAKVKATEEHFAKTQAATAKAGSTTVISYEDEQTGFPAAPTKYSFRKLLDSLSAEEYQKRLNEDPAFRKSVDALNG